MGLVNLSVYSVSFRLKKAPFLSLFRGADTAKTFEKDSLFLSCCKATSGCLPRELIPFPLGGNGSQGRSPVVSPHRSLIQPPKDKREDCAPPVSSGRGCGKGPREDQEMASGISGIRTMHQSGNLVRRQELSTNPLTDGGQ